MSETVKKSTASTRKVSAASTVKKSTATKPATPKVKTAKASSTATAIKTPAPKAKTAKLASKITSSVIAEPETKPTTVKKTRKPATPKPSAAIKPEQFYQMVATAAYYLAESRGFVPGFETHDWFTAEAQIRAQYPL